MIWERLRGHGPVVDLFRRAIGRERLAHAYAFAGPAGIGKATFARSLATCLVCSTHDDADLAACGTCNDCRQMAAKSHPDVFFVGCPAGKKTIPISAIVGEENRRGREGLCHDLSLRPMSADRRIAIIDDADRLGIESANSLLKTLEEPPRNSLLILVTEDFDSLLPTIRSRCQPIRFSPLADDDVAALLLEQGSVESTEEAAAVAGVAGGSLAVAGQLLDPRVREMRETLHRGFVADPVDPFGLAETVVGGIEGLGGDRQEQRRAAGWVIRFALDMFRRTLRETTDAREPTDSTKAAVRLASRLAETGYPVETIGALIESCDEAGRRIEGNSPVPLVMEALFDDLARTIGPTAAGASR